MDKQQWSSNQYLLLVEPTPIPLELRDGILIQKPEGWKELQAVC